MAEMKNVLRVEHVTMQFGGVVAVDDLSMEVNEGEIVALIGPNGAGKTTAFNVITGVYAPTNGQVLFNGKRVVENHPKGKLRRQYKGKHMGEYKAVLEPTPDKLTKMGMARTFQNIRLWKSMTVFDNVLIAKHLRRSSNMFTAMFRLNAREEARQRAEVLELLRVVGLEDVKDELALRQAAAAGDRPGAGHRPHAAAAGRAGGGHEPAGDAGAGGVHPGDPGEVPQDGAAHRAPHGSGHGHRRPHLCAGLRRAHRTGHAGGDPKQRARHRRLSGGGRRC